MERGGGLRFFDVLRSFFIRCNFLLIVGTMIDMNTSDGESSSLSDAGGK